MSGLTLADEAEALLALFRGRGWMIAAAESCTGGLITATLTAVAGSSDVVDRGFVTYSNAAKTEMLGVPEKLIAAHGAVSEAVAAAMATGALARSRSTVAVSCTGIAGPGGGTADKPVGLVYLGRAVRADGEIGCAVERHVLPGDRAAIRQATVLLAFRLARETAERD